MQKSLQVLRIKVDARNRPQHLLKLHHFVLVMPGNHGHFDVGVPSSSHDPRQLFVDRSRSYRFLVSASGRVGEPNKCAELINESYQGRDVPHRRPSYSRNSEKPTDRLPGTPHHHPRGSHRRGHHGLGGRRARRDGTRSVVDRHRADEARPGQAGYATGNGDV